MFIFATCFCFLIAKIIYPYLEKNVSYRIANETFLTATKFQPRPHCAGDAESMKTIFVVLSLPSTLRVSKGK